ncbi:MAG: S9 family peptidase [Planctomycetia bacterium]|nr:S9 family peptidase [Planctomycetia bacterium]
MHTPRRDGLVSIACSTVTLALTLAGAAPATELTLERIMGSPALSGPVPRGLGLSPDGRLATLLRPRPDDRERYDLWAIDTTSGAERMLVDSTLLGSGAEVSEEEKMRRERARLGGTRGVVEYAWARDGRSILVPLDGDLFVATVADDRVQRVTATPETELDPRLSPRGRFVSFVRDQNLVLHDLRTGRERTLTSDGGGAVSWGVAEFVAQEEMDRHDGVWWSPDESMLVVARVDETDVPLVTRAAIGADGTRVHAQRYPRAGAANARVGLWVFRTDTPAGPASPEGTASREATVSPDQPAPLALDLGPDPDIYVARVAWAPDSRSILVQRQSRDQRRVDLLRFDPATGEGTVVATEEQATWVNLTDDLRSLPDGRLLVSSERDGYRHLWILGGAKAADGSGAEQVTRGPWAIDKLVGLDTAAGTAFFIGWTDTPLERHLYAVDLPRPGRPAGVPRRLTEPGGWHDATMDDAASRALVTRSTPTQPPQTFLADATGRRIRWIEENRPAGAHPYAPFMADHVAPEFGTLVTPDGTTLHYSHLRPRLAAGTRAPALVIVYGGPGVGPLAARRWGSLTAQYFARRGWHVFSLDNRGTSGRGKAFEDPIHRALGQIEVADQMLGHTWLASRDDVDPARIAVQGWSYGGYMALRLLAAHPGSFVAGVAGAPVTAWDLYDTHYTERYLGHPGHDRGPYDRADVVPVAERITDPLLVIHGMADDNVIFDNTAALAARLQRSGRLFEMMVYPGQTHRIAGPELGVHLWRSIEDFLDRRADGLGRTGRPDDCR